MDIDGIRLLDILYPNYPFYNNDGIRYKHQKKPVPVMEKNQAFWFTGEAQHHQGRGNSFPPDELGSFTKSMSMGRKYDGK